MSHRGFVWASIFVLLVLSIPGSCQSTQPKANGAQGYASDMDENSGLVGAGVKVSTLGGGAEVAVRVTHRTNVRAGFNAISYSRGFDKDGIDYHGGVNFKTFEAHYDIFPWAKGFHVSGGVQNYIEFGGECMRVSRNQLPVGSIGSGGAEPDHR